MRKLTIIKDEVLKMDISNLSNSQCPWNDWNIYIKDHYRLCAYLSTKFNKEVFIDAGTFHGNSAISLSYNLNNTVRTYDIVDNDFDSFKQRGNIIPIKKDINTEDKDILLSSPLIMLDIDPHDGKQEMIFTDLLRNIGYNGFLLCDDIHINTNMQFWWNTIKEPNYDLTDIGHLHGTGLICFGDIEAEII